MQVSFDTRFAIETGFEWSKGTWHAKLSLGTIAESAGKAEQGWRQRLRLPG
jgi:hypothetical protein